MIIDLSLRQAIFLPNAYTETVLRNDPRKHCLGRFWKETTTTSYIAERKITLVFFSTQCDLILIFYSQSRSLSARYRLEISHTTMPISTSDQRQWKDIAISVSLLQLVLIDLPCYFTPLEPTHLYQYSQTPPPQISAPSLDFHGKFRWSFYDRCCEWSTKASNAQTAWFGAPGALLSDDEKCKSMFDSWVDGEKFRVLQYYDAIEEVHKKLW